MTIEKIPNNSNGCGSGGKNEWSCGWIVCEDSNGNGICNTDDSVLQRVNAPSRVQVTRPAGSGASIKVNRWGLVDGPYLSFSLVPLGKSATDTAARGVCMSSGGRVKVIEVLPCSL